MRFFAALLAIVAACTATSGDNVNDSLILLVANRSSHEVTFVDIERGVVLDRIATGEGPHLLSNVSDDRVLATGYGEFPRPHEEPVSSRPPFVSVPNSRFTLIDVASRTVILQGSFDACAKPHASWIVGPRAYVTCESERRLLVLHLGSAEVVEYFDTGQDGSHVLAFEPSTSTLAVSNTGSGSVTLFDLPGGNPTIVELAGGSEGLLAYAGRIWVSNALDGSVSVVDPGTAGVARHIKSVCSFPIALGAGSQERMWIACFASAELVAIDQRKFVVSQRIKLRDMPLNLQLHPTQELAYVSLPRANAIAEIDLQTGEELRRIRVGIEPDGLRWATNRR